MDFNRTSTLGILAIGVTVLIVSEAEASKVMCPVCGKVFPEGTQICPTDGTDLKLFGHSVKDEDAKKITVVNGDDGTWSIRSEGKEISKGTSTFDPTKKPKTIDFTPTEGGGKGDRFLGIYRLGKNARKLCFAPAGKDRPTEFSSTPENQQILVTFERVMSE